MANDLKEFNSIEEARQYADENFESKYDTELVKVGDRYVWLVATSMVDDESLRGNIEDAVRDFIEGWGLDEYFDEDTDTIAIDFGAELTGLAYVLFSKWYNFDVEYIWDTY